MFNLSIYNGCIVDKRTIVVPYKKFTNLYHQLLLRLEAIDCWSLKVPYDAFTSKTYSEPAPQFLSRAFLRQIFRLLLRHRQSVEKHFCGRNNKQLCCDESIGGFPGRM